jgi:hypothetical protein
VLIALPALIIGGTSVYVSHKISAKQQKEEDLNAGIQAVESLTLLRNEIQDTFSYQRLENLHEDIETYIYNNQLSDLKEQILALIDSYGIEADQISWAVQDLTTDAYISSDNASVNFTAASTYKLPLSLIYYEMIAEGTVSPSTTYEFTEAMKEDEDKENPFQPIGRKYSVGDKIQLDELLEAALLYSDNIAGHILYENLGGYSAFKTLALRFTDDVQDKEFTGQANLFNANFMMDLVHYMYNTEGTFNDARYWLTYSVPEGFLNAQVPYTYIQKTGNLTSVRNAIGLYAGSFPYSVVVYSDISKSTGEAIIGEIGALCYNYFYARYVNGDYASYDSEKIATLSNQTGSPAEVINNRAGLNGQTVPEISDEEYQKALEESLAE